jgi:hypothetical protein
MRAAKPHPLKVWLKANVVAVEDFGAKHSISFNALYGQFGSKKDPRLSTLLAIEKATKREVTVQMVADWFSRRK